MIVLSSISMLLRIGLMNIIQGNTLYCLSPLAKDFDNFCLEEYDCRQRMSIWIFEMS